MSRASAVLSGLAAALLVLIVGNPPAIDAIFERLADRQSVGGLTGQTASFLSWDVFDQFGDLGPAAIVRTVLFVVLAALLGGIAGRSTKLAALIGGWGAGMIAAIVASVGYLLVIDPQFAVVANADPSLTDRISFGVQLGAAAGVLPSVVIAVAVAIGARPKPTAAAAPAAPAPQAWAQAPVAAAPAPAPPPGAPVAQGAPPVAAAPGAPAGGPAVGGPAVGAPPPRSGAAAPTTIGPSPGPTDETQKIQLPPS